jgi:hypothetical protein
MLGVGATGNALAVYAGNVPAAEVYLGSQRVWPESDLYTFSYTGNSTSATHNWVIPTGAKRVDLIVCGSGAGGSNGTPLLGPGVGGGPGQWASVILTVGTNVAAGATVTFNIGKGGTGGGALNIPGSGYSSDANYQAIGQLIRPIGNGGKALASTNAIGGTPTALTVNGYTYTGGAGGSNNGTGPGTAGGVPGGGGGGGGQAVLTQLGGDGGHGVAYARVYY